jgi:hypothetical protein
MEGSMKKLKEVIEKTGIELVGPNINLDEWGGELPQAITTKKAGVFSEVIKKSEEEAKKILKKMHAIREIKVKTCKPGRSGMLRMIDVLEKAGNFDPKKKGKTEYFYERESSDKSGEK